MGKTKSGLWSKVVRGGTVAILGAVAACSQPAPTDTAPQQALTPQELEAERGVTWTVSGKWTPVVGLRAFSVSNPLVSTIVSTTTRSVNVIVEARGFDQRVIRTTKSLGLELTAGVPTQVNLTPADIPLQSIGGIAQVKVLVTYYSDTSELVTVPVGPERMFVTHSLDYSQAWATSDNVLALGIAAQYARQNLAVDPTALLTKTAAYAANPSSDVALGRQLILMATTESGRFRKPTGAWQTLATAQAGLPYTGGGGFRWSETLYNSVRAASPLPANHFDTIPPKNVKVCPSVRPGFRDNGPEAYLKDEAAPLPGVGVAIESNSTPVLKFVGRLDAEGCATISINDTAPCFGVRLYSTNIGGGNPSFTIYANNETSVYDTGICFKPSFFSDPTSYTIYMGSSIDEPMSRIMAVASRITAMPDNGFIEASSSPHKIEAELGCAMFPSNVPGKNGEACYDSSLDTAFFGVGLNPTTHVPLYFETTIDKFVVGHELGHMQQNWSTGTAFADYPGGATRPAACKCDLVTSANQKHCLNSRELVTTAQGEGWSHFFSSKVMNDLTSGTCSFGYYKEMWSPGNLTLSPPSRTRVSCTTPVRWRNNNCPAVETGTEWDWLTFLTTVHSQGINRLSMAELSDVYRGACGGHKCTYQTPLYWSSGTYALDPAAKNKFGVGSLKYAQWQSQANASGVSNVLTP